MKKVLRVIGILFVGIYLVAHYFPAEPTYTEAPEFEDGDFDEVDTLEQSIVVTHSRVWRDLTDESRNLRFSLGSTEEESAYKFRNRVPVNETSTEEVFWNSVYYQLFRHDQPALMPLKDSILALAHRDYIQAEDLLYTVVSFVQDIRYNYILSADSCATHTDFPCRPRERFGILSPVEFLYTLSGDCDTRTVLLFTLLKNLGFDPVIINSSQYHHSMLAVDIPSQGDYFLYKGRKFYFWETTSTGWMPGMMPPDMNNPDYWTVVLDYEYEADVARYY